MNTGFLGGVVDRSQPLPALGDAVDGDTWQWADRDSVAFLQARGHCCTLFTQGPLALLVRGYVSRSWTRAPLDLDSTAQQILDLYRSQGTLAIDGLEGSFTLVLMDGRIGKALLYRNLVGNGFTYYHTVDGGFHFGSNLAALLDLSETRPVVNEDALPTFFLNRCVPGRATLFAGCFRLLPGEQVSFSDSRLSQHQRRTLGDLREKQSSSHDALDQLESTMSRILADYRALRPDASNLLSGGVDSSYLQVHWNETQPRECGQPMSFCVSVDHPRSQPDTDYALTAAEMLGTRHVLVPADEPYSRYLIEAIATTAEPPNHVQTAYFSHLGQVMLDNGAATGLCGEGADSLFGLDLACFVQNAAIVRRLCPLKPLRRGGAMVARLLRFERVRQYFQLADYVHDQENPLHPVNQAAVFADWPAVQACFGRDAVAASVSARRSFLDEYHVPTDPLERLHAAGYLGSAVNTASLKTTLFNVAGNDLLCPFLDSRLLRLVLNLSQRERFRFRKPKELLKRSLARHGHAELAYRRKLGFGQPIFEWMSPGGCLRPLVDEIESYAFVPAETLRQAKDRPSWFLYSLLCFDLWHKMFVQRSMPRVLLSVAIA